MGDGLTAFFYRDHRHFLALDSVAAERRVDHACGSVGRAPDQGEIFPRQRQFAAVVGKETRQAVMRLVGLGDHQQSRRILVQPMHDARPLHPADP